MTWASPHTAARMESLSGRDHSTPARQEPPCIHTIPTTGQAVRQYHALLQHRGAVMALHALAKSRNAVGQCCPLEGSPVSCAHSSPTTDWLVELVMEPPSSNAARCTGGRPVFCAQVAQPTPTKAVASCVVWWHRFSSAPGRLAWIVQPFRARCTNSNEDHVGRRNTVQVSSTDE